MSEEGHLSTGQETGNGGRKVKCVTERSVLCTLKVKENCEKDEPDGKPVPPEGREETTYKNL